MAQGLWIDAVRKGLAAARPIVGEPAPDGFVFYYATDTNVLSLYDGTAWRNVANYVSGSVNVAADVLAIPVTHSIVRKTTGADAEALTLANGVPGQVLVITLVVDGGGDGTLTPTTKTGWATIVFADAGDTATLQYIDDTVGWVILGLSGVAAPPAMTV